MALTLPRGGAIFLPQLPTEFTDLKQTHKYLQDLITEIELQLREARVNTSFVLDTGTSGTFVDSDGNTVTVQSGIITGLV